MHGAHLSFLKKITIVTNTLIWSVVLALYYFYAQGSNKFGSLKKASSTRETTKAPAAAVTPCFRRLHSTIPKVCVDMAVFYFTDIYLSRLQSQKRAMFFVYEPRLRSYIVLTFRYLKVARVLQDGVTKQLPALRTQAY